VVKAFVAVITAGVAATGLVVSTPALGGTAASGSSAGSRQAVAPAAGSGVHWGRCPADIRGLGERCGTLKVPRNYHRPHGAQIRLAVALRRHTSSRDLGVILTNFGGPGEPGLDASGAFLPFSVPHGVGDDYDWVSWDPRGVGHSSPSIHCKARYFHGDRRSYVPTSQKILHYWKRRSKSYAAACKRKYPHLLKHMTTIDSARDMESIRKAFGVPQISYYGFSYGTYLGQVYSTLFPSHINRMVLDSNVDPRHVWYQSNLNQDKAFNRNIRIYFRWVAKYRSVYHLGKTERSVQRRYYSDLASLTATPQGKLGPDEFNDAFQQAAYYRFGWEAIAEAWVKFSHGKPRQLADLGVSPTGVGSDNSYAIYAAVECTDAHWPQHWSTWQRDNTAYNNKYPFLTWDNAWFNAPCLYWGAKAHKPVRINGTKTSSVLLIDETLDAATPYQGSLEVRSRYPNSRLIAEPGGTTHADSLNGDRCVDNKIAAYLAHGRLPSRKHGRRADVTCAPLHDPNPRADQQARGVPAGTAWRLPAPFHASAV
jgi:pimeloyl-ACP methyl ester carboxylesterase